MPAAPILGTPLVLEYTPTRYRTFLGAYASAGLVSVGGLLASTVSALLITTIGWRGLFVVGAAPIVLVVWGAVAVRESPRWFLAAQRPMQCVGERWYLYLSHFWHSGWTVMDVTDAESPELIRFVEGPTNTLTSQVQVADGLMVTSLEKPFAEIYGADTDRFEEGVLAFDVATDPASPVPVGRYSTGGVGTHRNFWAGGRYAYLAAQPDGFDGNMLVVLDLADPRNPVEAARWWWPGQAADDDDEPSPYDHYMHGPAYVHGQRAYVSYGRVGAVILDVTDPAEPALVSRVDFGDLGSVLGCHSAVPIPDRDLLIVNSEAIKEGYDEPLNYAFIVDIADEHRPRIIGQLPIPTPEERTGFRNYQEKGGRFGPHNQAHHQGHSVFRVMDDHVLMTYFNAGLRLYDIRDPYNPVESGYFVPTDPPKRLGPLPSGRLVNQSEDVIVDARGYVYSTDKNQGLFVLRFDDLT